uniref:Uncharacterized protein n=1 Tax=Anguilla anguilla TaxID=7936 RepID=A0A0E9QFG5_ANGAN
MAASTPSAFSFVWLVVTLYFFHIVRLDSHCNDSGAPICVSARMKSFVCAFNLHHCQQLILVEHQQYECIRTGIWAVIFADLLL